MSPRTSPRTGFWLVAAALGVLVSASAAPSPIFPVYQAEWGLGPSAVTVVFAVYAAVLLVALLTVGSLSDHLGRRPVVLAAIAGVVASMLAFVLADSTGWLVAARALQGFSTGTAIGALGAWLLDLAGPRRGALAQVVNGAVPPLGLMAGGLGSGLLVEFAPAPTRTVYALLAVLLAVCAAALVAVPDAAARVPGALRSLTPVVRLPRASRSSLVRFAPGFLASWGLGGFVLGLGPSVVAGVLGRTDHVTGGLVVAAVAGVGALVGVLTRAVRPARLVAVGMLALVVGPLLVVLALERSSTALFFTGAAVSGIGFGGGFQGALRGVLATAPADERAGVLSAVYVMSYLAFGLPAVVAGFLAPSLGLREVADGYAALVVVVGLAGLVLTLVGSRRASGTGGLPAPRRPAPARRAAAPQVKRGR